MKFLNNIHISKRNNVSFKKNFLIRTIAILGALLFCSLIIFALFKYNPLSFIISIFDGNFGTKRRIWTLLYDAAILLALGLALVPPFKMKFWNTGADGQALMGGLGAAIVIFGLGGKTSNAVVVVLSLLLALLFGAIWAIIPAIFKALWNTNETLFTLMMNYVAIQFVKYYINIKDKTGHAILGASEYGHLPELLNEWFFTILIVAVLTAIISLYIKYTKHGYELLVVGDSVNTALYVGINVKKVIIRTMLVSGLVCGLVGFLLVSGRVHSISESTLDGRGFTAIIVAWLAHVNPLYMILTSLFVTFINLGTKQMMTDINITNNAFQSIIIGIFFFFIIGCEFFINYKISFKKKEEKAC